MAKMKALLYFLKQFQMDMVKLGDVMSLKMFIFMLDNFVLGNSKKMVEH